MSGLHLTTIHLTRPLPQCIQSAHATIATITDGVPGRTLWVSTQPTVITIQASRPVPHTGARRTTPVRTTYETGDHVYLSLIANPTRRHPRTGAIEPVPLVDQEAWVTRKLTPALTITELAVDPLTPAHGYRRGSRITQTRTGYYARATVTEPDSLAALIRDGVGRGKAYGAGLLLVAAA